MRGYVIGTPRLLNFTDIADGTRWARDDFRNPLIALGLTRREFFRPWVRAG
ncbi:hypothetical protein GCM10009555_104980 [Acrocarpospora macrocephala]|uniref:Uncharacterized protein n=1 Tax=Acrocarpospora macrocephala TaxID=150177 RepID=A0A5M3X0B0_9ACTN|nr:hypothetical protein [Acrocarpospora macrocephala]GES13569.1 hypothetical protein Amac_071660 [Acrocarpospora macrocephala]